MKPKNKEIYPIRIEILPCPLCGGEADISYNGEYRFVICLECKCRGPKIDVTNYPAMSNIKCYEDSIKLWNKRT